MCRRANAWERARLRAYDGIHGGTTVEFRILGPIELWVNGQRYDLGSPKERCVLAILLWKLGQPVSADSLIDMVWGGNPPDSALASLYFYISRLRRDLKRAVGEDRAWLRGGSGYYILDAGADTVDLCQFRELRDQARAVARHGDDERAAALLHEADNLWRGAPLTGLSATWADGVRARLEEERLGAIRDRIECELRLGRHAALIGEISDLVAQHPFDQALVGHLMIALYRTGRLTDALETYRRTHGRLVEETGSEPAAALRILHQRMLNADPELDEPPVRQPPAPQLPAGTQPDSLPRDNPHFTGRVTELEQLFDLINTESGRGSVTVVAINGMAGIGKSTLAIHAAHLLGDRYPDRFYLHLHTHDPIEEPVDPAAGLGTLLRTLGVPPGELPGTLEERATMWRTKLANRRALIVLEDADSPDQIRPLLPGSSRCLVLITCRRRMIGLPGIFWVPLDVMRPDEAASLFVRVAGSERIQDPHAISRIVRMCGYHPLAIQLAASRFSNHPAWSVTDLAARLPRGQQRLGEISAQDRELAGSLELSYRYLTGDQQRLFRHLALHPGVDFSVYTAAAAADSESLPATERALEVLLDHHLLEEREPGRYTFHDLVREYACQLSELEDGEPDRQRTVHRMLDYYLCLADRADRIVYPFHRRLEALLEYVPANVPPLSGRDDARKSVEAEHANLLGVMQYATRHGWSGHAALLPHVLAQFLESWGYWEDAAAAHRLSVRIWREAGNRAREARALTELCFILTRTSGYAEALQCAHDALNIVRALADRVGEADILDCMGLILWQSSRFPEALSRHDEALAIWRSIQDRHGEADALGHGAIPLLHISRYEDALKRLNQALLIYRETGDPSGEANTLNNIAEVQQQRGFHDEALDCYQRVMIIVRELGDRQREAILFNNIGNLCRHAGQYDQSLKHYRNALRTYRAIGDRRCESDALNNIGMAFYHVGHFGEALNHHLQALVLAHELAEPYQEARSHHGAGDVHLETGNHAAALRDYRSALEISRRIGDVYQEALAWNGVGNVLAHTEGDAAARQHWRMALDLFEQIGVPEAGSVRNRLRGVGATAS
jgi:DNA-binding SARP family transcriptional activator/tetratricopeptide (TPR) repeat protein